MAISAITPIAIIAIEICCRVLKIVITFVTFLYQEICKFIFRTQKYFSAEFIVIPVEWKSAI